MGPDLNAVGPRHLDGARTLRVPTAPELGSKNTRAVRQSPGAGPDLVVRLVTAEAGEVVTRYYRELLPALAKLQRVARCGGHLLDVAAAPVAPGHILIDTPNLPADAWRPLAEGVTE